jgi:hypothetical protein
MADRTFSRRVALEGGAALAGAFALRGFGGALRTSTEDRPALAVIWLNGGPAGLFNSAGSFVASGAFGVTGTNVRRLGNDLVVDAGSFGALPAAARAHGLGQLPPPASSVRTRPPARGPRVRAAQPLLRLASVLPPAPIVRRRQHDWLACRRLGDAAGRGWRRLDASGSSCRSHGLSTRRTSRSRAAYG